MRLFGRQAPGLSTWWVPNVPCLIEMMYCAGFDPVELVSKEVMLTTRH